MIKLYLSAIKQTILACTKSKCNPFVVFSTMIYCNEEVGMSTSRVVALSLYKLDKDALDTYLANYRIQLADAQWEEMYFSDFKFMSEYTQLKYDVSPEMLKKRSNAYAEHYNLPNDAYIQNNVVIYRAHNGKGQVSAGHSLTLARGVEIDASADVIFGNEVMVSEGAKIFTHGHNYKKFNKDEIIYHDNSAEFSPLKICDGAWIGAKATILAGCNYIGKGAIIGACSVVTKDVPDYAVVAGNPAKIINYRE